MRFAASATRCGSSASSAKGLAVFTAQNPQARVQRSPAIMNVAVPWLQHSQRFGHCASSHTVCSRRSDTSALVLQNTGSRGSFTRIQSGFFSLCSAGSILGGIRGKFAVVCGGLQWLTMVWVNHNRKSQPQTIANHRKPLQTVVRLLSQGSP